MHHLDEERAEEGSSIESASGVVEGFSSAAKRRAKIMDGETILDFTEVVTEYYIVSSDAKGGIRADDSVVMNKADTKPSLPDGGARGTRERTKK